ncbi:MAG TPA: 1,4-alpha-glucan branching protein domain-containing protein [Solirubrobacteraceae bacterium]
MSLSVQRGDQGELALVLHTHMPYVEGFGTWPFGEEWLWEAVATSYLPLLDVLAAPGGDRVTLSITPVLADQLEMAGALERCVAFLETIRPKSHRLDIEELRAGGQDVLAAELERSAGEYAARARRLRELSAAGGLLGALTPYTSWTSSATHAILPLLPTDAGALLQVQTGVASHRRRFGGWHGGFWLPECAHAPWLDELLEDAGVRATCVELTGVFGLGDPRHLRPLVATDGPVLWPLDRTTIALVWGVDGYPSRGPYRDSHRHTTHRHHAWRNDGGAYDHGAAVEQARADAAEFVSHVRRRVAGGGVCVCALDTELLGHWWYEGVHWLAAVLEESARQGLALTTLDDALDRHDPAPAPEALPVSSWGDGGDLRTWSGPQVAALAWPARAAELRLAAMAGRPPERALRELLALQSSDWAFLHTRATAGDYPIQRARGHLAALERALAGDAGLIAQPTLRGLAPDLTGWG